MKLLHELTQGCKTKKVAFGYPQFAAEASDDNVKGDDVAASAVDKKSTVDEKVHGNE